MDFSNISNAEFVRIIEKAVHGNSKEKFKIILMFENLITKKAHINGIFSQECKDYIEDKLFYEIEKFKKI